MSEGPAELSVREGLERAGFGPHTINLMLDQLQFEWKQADRKPNHECSFDLEGEGCHTCGIPYEEWIRLDRS